MFLSKVEYLINNHFEKLEFKFDLIVFMILSTNEKVFDFNFNIDSNSNLVNLIIGCKNGNKKIDIHHLNLKDFYFEEDNANNIINMIKEKMDFDFRIDSKLIKSTAFRCNVSFPLISFRILNSKPPLLNGLTNSFDNVELTDFAKTYINKTFDSFHLSSLLEKKLKTKIINRDKIKI